MTSFDSSAKCIVKVISYHSNVMSVKFKYLGANEASFGITLAVYEIHNPWPKVLHIKKSGFKHVFPLKLRPKQATVTSVSVNLNIVTCWWRGAFSPLPPTRSLPFLVKLWTRWKVPQPMVMHIFAAQVRWAQVTSKRLLTNFVSKQPPTQILVIVVWSYHIKKDAKCTGTK